jgi:uncharacterized protein YbaR (Trm112 family)
MYLNKIKQEAEELACKFCGNPMTDSEEMTMIQSTECFHQVHVKCLKKEIIAQSNINVCCPRCKRQIQKFETTQYLSEQEAQEIDLKLFQQMVNENESMVVCSCGNVMDFVPGEVQKGLKDDKG